MDNDRINHLILIYLRNLRTIDYISRKLNMPQDEIETRIFEMQNSGIQIPNMNTSDSKMTYEIFRHLKFGFSISEIARKFNLSEEYIIEQLEQMKQNNINIPTVMLLTSSDRIILRYKAQGLSDEEIAKELQVSNVKKYVTYRLKLMKENGYLIPYSIYAQEQPAPLIKQKENPITLHPSSEIINRTHKRTHKDYTEIYIKILILLQQNCSITQIAEKLQKCNNYVVRRIAELKQLGIISHDRLKTRNNSPRNLSKRKQTDYSAIYVKIKKLLEKNYSQSQIGAEIGRAQSYVSNRIAEMIKLGIIEQQTSILPSEEATQKAIIKVLLRLKETKGATLEQLQELAQTYNIHPNLIAQALNQNPEGR